MEGRFAVPFHFAVEFLFLVVALGAAFDAVRLARRGSRWAWGQALGFVALAVAQVAHSALLRSADGDRFLVVVRTVGFVVLALGARPAAAVAPPPPPAAGGIAPALIVPGTHARFALVPAAAALLVAFRGIRAHRSDQDPATFAFASGFVALAVSEAALYAAPATGGGLLFASHIARGIGALLLARWLWSSIVRSVRARFVASFVTVLALVVLAISASLNLVIGDTIEDEELKRLVAVGEARVTSFQDLGDTGVGSAELLARQDGLIEALRRSDEDAAALYGRVAFEVVPNTVDFVMFVDRRGRVIGSDELGKEGRRLPRSHEIAYAGTQVVNEAIDAGRRNESPITVTVPSRSGRTRPQLAVLAAAPSKATGGRVNGAVVIGFLIDGRALAAIGSETDSEATVLVGNRIAGSTLDDRAALVGALAPVDADLRAAREEARALTRTVRIGGSSFVSAFVPVASPDGQVLGHLMLAREATALAGAERDVNRTLFLITIVAVILAALLAWLSGGRVTRPIRSLTAAAMELRGGNLGARARVSTADEVGQLGTAFNEMASELGRTTGALRDAAVEEGTLRARLEAVLQSMGDGLIATDSDGRIVTFNRAAESLFHAQAQRVTGKALVEVIGGGPLADAAAAGRATEGILARGDGSVVPVALGSAPLRDAAGEPIGRVVVLRDMTPQHQAERMKSEFLANVSHELRTPLTPIKGYLDILMRKKLTRDKTEHFLDQMLQSVGRLERIVEILVDFAALEAGRLKPRAEPVPVRVLVDDAIERWRKRDPAHEFVRRSTADVAILGDPRLLGRSLDELLDNAVKFSPNGGKIEVEADASNGVRGRRGGSIRITVRDRGIGIEPERIADLFQDFRQLDGSETRTYGGLGLGLAYVKRIADAHGGEVLVESRPGKGSAFSIVLPAADTSRRPREGRTPAAARKRTAGRIVRKKRGR